jgi:hypothetical protein
MSLLKKKVITFHLVHPDTAVKYSFYPHGAEVEMTVVEARQLWKRLEAKGYERF